MKKKAKPESKIADKKKRGEWVELQFMAEAAEHDLPASKPLGDSENFDVVVGRPGKFVAVQVKCTVFRSKNGEGYVCSVRSSHKVYRAGAFDFLAAHVVPEKAWYILPAKEIVGMRAVTLCTPTGRYEQYRDAWKLLQDAVGLREAAEIDPGRSKVDADEEAPAVPSPALRRMETAFNLFRRRLQGE